MTDKSVTLFRHFLKIQTPDDIFAGDFLENRFGDFLFIAQFEQKVHQRSRGIGRTNIGTEHEPVLKFVEEFNCIFFITGQSVPAAAGRYISIQIRIFAHQLGNGAFFFDFAFRVAVALLNGGIGGDFGPESLAVAEEFQFWKFL